jgi:biotin synthase
MQAAGPRTSWTKEEIAEVYNTALIDLTFAAVGSLPLRSTHY